MTLQEKILNLKNKIENIITFQKAEIAKIDFVNAMLKNDNFSEIPSDYKNFLMFTNGLIMPPVELYGTENVERAKYNYKFPNIIEVNKIFIDNKNPLIKNRLMLGTFAFDILIFDGNDNLYKILNRFNFETIETFKSFNELFDYISEE